MLPYLAAVIDKPDLAVEARRLCDILESALLHKGTGEATARAVADNVNWVVQKAIGEAEAERRGRGSLTSPVPMIAIVA